VICFPVGKSTGPEAARSSPFCAGALPHSSAKTTVRTTDCRGKDVFEPSITPTICSGGALVATPGLNTVRLRSCGEKGFDSQELKHSRRTNSLAPRSHRSILAFLRTRVLEFTAMVGTRSRGSRRRSSDNDIRCSASDRRWFPARPAQHVHRRRNNGRGPIQSELASAHGRNGERRGETCNAGRAGVYRRSEALHPIRSSDVLPRIARERVPTVPTLRKRVPTPERVPTVVYCFCAPSIFSNFFTFGATTSRQYP